MHERDQLYGHGVKVSQSKLRRLRAKRVRYRLWSTARGPDPSCLVRAGIFAPRYYRNLCSDDSEEEEWVEDTCGTQTDMDAVELAGNSLRSQCSDRGAQTDPCVHIECGTQTDLCVLFVGEEEKEECHRVRADQGDASAVGSSCAVGSSTVRSAVGSSTVRSSADAVVDAVGSSTAGSSAVGSTAVWSSADAVASNPGCKDEEEDNVHSEAVAKMEQEEVAEEDFVHVGEGEKEECHRVHVDRGDASLRMKRYCFKRTETIESTKLHTSELHATNGSAVESTAVLSTVDAVGSSSAVGSSTLGSAVGSSTVRSSADAVVDAVGSSTAWSSAVGSTVVWSSADAVGSSMTWSSAVAVGSSTEADRRIRSDSVVGSSAVGSSAVWSSSDALGSSTTGSLSNAVVSTAVTEDECRAARDWARANDDAVL
ncbi:unnamed protein product [Prorocentrum cordatum]|uniref:Uncharacterized protein n=1 Tax=Prorocentrum cordatum TaxID=2364126 RepID=A0ABN9WU80_9DINO|nr:unnamed protein product [Polarella glacialis]